MLSPNAPRDIQLHTPVTALRRIVIRTSKTLICSDEEISNRSEETQLSSHRPCAPTCPATRSGQFRRHPRCYHRMHRETFNYIHHVTALRRIVIRTSKSAPQITVLEQFHFHVRFATVPGNCSTVERQKMLRGLQFFNILTFKCAFRHSGVQFFDI